MTDDTGSYASHHESFYACAAVASHDYHIYLFLRRFIDYEAVGFFALMCDNLTGYPFFFGLFLYRVEVVLRLCFRLPDNLGGECFVSRIYLYY